MAPPDTFFTGEIRYLSLHKSLSLTHLITGENRTLFTAPAAGEFYYPGNKSAYRSIDCAVHSLILDGNFPVFHPCETKAGYLRPDVAASHAVSPGARNPENRYNMIYKISEIYPAGSLDNDGLSHSGDQFIEIEAGHQNPDSAGTFRSGEMITLQSTDQSGSIRTLHLPPPEQPGLYLYSAKTPYCFSTADVKNSAVVNDLLLPNGAPHFRLQSGNNRENHHETTINSNLYEKLNKNGIRRSLEWIDDANSFVVTQGHGDGEGSFSGGVQNETGVLDRCRQKSYATPLHSNWINGYFRWDTLAPSGGMGSFFTSLQNATLRISYGTSLENIIASEEINTHNAHIITISPPEGISDPRLLVHVSQKLDGIYYTIAAESIYPDGKEMLRVETVAPVPLIPQNESIRLCSPHGFDSSLFPGGLFIRDSSSTDQLVPYLSRFAHLPPGVTLNGSTLELPAGECAWIVDPDYQGDPLEFQNNDLLLWTVESGSAIGNGLAAREGILIFGIDSSGNTVPITSYGLPDSLLPFTLNPAVDQQIVRKSKTWRDSEESYEVLP